MSAPIITDDIRALVDERIRILGMLHDAKRLIEDAGVAYCALSGPSDRLWISGHVPGVSDYIDVRGRIDRMLWDKLAGLLGFDDELSAERLGAHKSELSLDKDRVSRTQTPMFTEVNILAILQAVHESNTAVIS